MKRKTNEQAIKALVKNLSNTPHGIGLALLRERLLKTSAHTRKAISENPEMWDDILLTHLQWLDFCDRIDSILAIRD